MPVSGLASLRYVLETGIQVVEKVGDVALREDRRWLGRRLCGRRSLGRGDRRSGFSLCVAEFLHRKPRDGLQLSVVVELKILAREIADRTPLPVTSHHRNGNQGDLRVERDRRFPGGYFRGGLALGRLRRLCPAHRCSDQKPGASRTSKMGHSWSYSPNTHPASHATSDNESNSRTLQYSPHRPPFLAKEYDRKKHL